METVKALPLPMPGLVTPANAAKPAVAAEDTPPWLMEEPAPIAPPRKPAAPAIAAPARKVETLHWGIVALTLFTAASLLFGSHGASQSQELLPVMIKVPVR